MSSLPSHLIDDARLPSIVPRFEVAAASLRSSGWEVAQVLPNSTPMQLATKIAFRQGMPPNGPGSGRARLNCEFINITSASLAPRVRQYVSAFSKIELHRDEEAFWVPLVREYAASLGLFGVVWLAYTKVVAVPHVALHVMGFVAADHAGSEECIQAGGSADDLYARCTC